VSAERQQVTLFVAGVEVDAAEGTMLVHGA